ncbi:hypothetical protein AAGQ96_15220 [Pantoea sp. MBD-2R]|uniref:hypothetical protein n=1 Tax=unclassified Pantoea TaxID=2630326 RepID=UPI00143DFB84|nr:hypothetical protein [Pantoea sp. CCBC3-3-1]
MKKIIKVATVLGVMMMLNGCIIHDGYRGGGHHGGGYHGGNHHGHGPHRGW